jgi:hypothetical protein
MATLKRGCGLQGDVRGAPVAVFVTARSRIVSRCLHSAYTGEGGLIAMLAKSLILLVPLPRLERGTPRSTIWCSNQLSYSGERGA